MIRTPKWHEMMIMMTAVIQKKRKLPEWMLHTAKATLIVEEESRHSKAIADAELALEILEEYSEAMEARQSRSEWGIFDYLGQEEEDMEENEEEFNLGDTDVAGNMSTDEAVAAILIAQSSTSYPYKNDRLRLMEDLRSSITLLKGV